VTVGDFLSLALSMLRRVWRAVSALVLRGSVARRAGTPCSGDLAGGSEQTPLQVVEGPGSRGRAPLAASGEQVPVGVEVVGRGVQELKPCQVRGASSVPDHGCVERAGPNALVASRFWWGSRTNATASVIASSAHCRLGREADLLGVRRRGRPEVGTPSAARARSNK
jgi:hypothetical protein